MNASSTLHRLAPARHPRPPLSQRLLHVEPRTYALHELAITDLPARLEAGDLLVVNDAGTLPASLRLTSHDAELRLIARHADGLFGALVFGAGDHTLPTEQRGPAPAFAPGAGFAAGRLRGVVVEVDREAPQLLRVRFELEGARLLSALYAVGRVVQYAYVDRPLELWDVQSGYASRPWAFEPPSAGLPLRFGVLEAIRARGVEIAALSHAAGPSSTGSVELDRRLPFPERYEIPEATMLALARCRARNGRVIAVGTTVVRALESSASRHGSPRAGTAEAELRLGPGFVPRVVSGLLTGMHEPGTSHFELLEAFAPRTLLDRAAELAARHGYLQHEFGDSCLIA